MPFIKSDQKKENARLCSLIKKSSKAKKAQDEFYNEYNFRMMLVKARKKVNLTQKELSDITGLSQQMISRVETGATDTTLKTLSKYLNGIGYNIKLTKSI